MKVRAKSSKRIVRAAAVNECLPKIIQNCSRVVLNDHLISNGGLNDCDDVESVWTVAVTFVLRLCALRLSNIEDDWSLLVHRNSAFLGCSSQQVDGIVSDNGHLIDEVISEVTVQTLEQRLSNIYEAILNMVPSFSRDHNGLRILQVKRLEKLKKRSGSFYSPSHLVDKTVQLALAPLVLESGRTKAKPLSEVLQLRIVDPAMGAGVFLTHAYRYLIELFPDCAQEEKIRIARDCLYGVDLDPLAVEVARLSLWLAVNSSMQSKLSYMDFQNLRVGNSLVGARVDRFKDLHNSINLKSNLDKWCSKWFTSEDPDEVNESDAQARLSAIAKNARFFHWEFEFPEVFDRNIRANPGFDAVIGNPPWEISKPNSREFFGMVEPNYWALGKQEALSVQQRLLANDPRLSAAWNSLQDRHRLFSTWVKKAPVQLDETVHPFECQGAGDLNLYKLFCEQSFYLAREGGSVALIVPAGLYSDSGARELRRLLLERNDWYHLSAFENSDGAFDIHRSFKYCIFAARKSGNTTRIETSFLGQASEYSRSTIAALSPKWSVLSEVESKATLSLLDRIYQNSDLLGSTKYGAYSIEYAREFDMTIDSREFYQRDKLENDRCMQDAYGNWLQGKWHATEKGGGGSGEGRYSDGIFEAGWKPALPGSANIEPHKFENVGNPGLEDIELQCTEKKLTSLGTGRILSACGKFVIGGDQIEDVYLPLFEGRMVGQFDFSEKHWVSGKGRRAVWQQSSSAGFGPQYLVRKNVFLQRYVHDELKVGFLAVGCATNARTMIASCLSAVPCGNSVPTLRFKTTQPADGGLTADELQLALAGFLNSFVFDFVIRRKMAGNNLNYFVIEECPLPKLTPANLPVFKQVANLVSYLNLGHLRYSRELNRMGCSRLPSILPGSAHFRVVRSFVDILVAHLYGLDKRDLSLILADELPGTETINTKGFFRLDRQEQPEERLPSLVLKHAGELEAIGLSAMMERIQTLAALERMSVDNRGDVTRGDLEFHAGILNEILNLST